MNHMIAILGGDARLAELAEMLKKDGYEVCTWGLTLHNAPNPTHLERAIEADTIVLPVPLSREKGYLNCEERKLPLKELWAALRPEQRIYVGNISAEDRVEALSYGLVVQDYFTREELAVQNAVPTAEGAIAAAMEGTRVTLHASPCLILGFGRIGKLLAHRLKGMGAEVSVSARRLEDLAWIDAFGYRALHTNRLCGKLGEFRVVFNTVPHIVLDEALLQELRGDCLLIELASRPGFDRAAAEKRGLSCILAGGLPGKVAPESAAKAIKTTLYQMWEEAK